MLKPLARRVIPRPVYFWLSARRQDVRWLVGYPDTARVGVVNYDDYWEAKAGTNMGSMSVFRRARAEAFARIVPQGSRLLDLGTGDGAILKYLIETRQVDGCGLDVSPKAVEFCRSQGLEVDLADVTCPVETYIPDRFDVILMSEIIEHIPDPERLLDALRDKADLLIVSVPNTGFYQHRLRLLLGKFPLQWKVTPGEHLRFWTLRDFRWWARQMRFRIVHEEAYRGTWGLKKLWPALFGQAMVYALKNAGR